MGERDRALAHATTHGDAPSDAPLWKFLWLLAISHTFA